MQFFTWICQKYAVFGKLADERKIVGSFMLYPNTYTVRIQNALGMFKFWENFEIIRKLKLFFGVGRGEEIQKICMGPFEIYIQPRKCSAKNHLNGKIKTVPKVMRKIFVRTRSATYRNETKMSVQNGSIIDVTYYYVIWTDKGVCYLKSTLKGKRGNMHP